MVGLLGNHAIPGFMATSYCLRARPLATAVANSLGEGRAMFLSRYLTAYLSSSPLCTCSKMACILCGLWRASQQRPSLLSVTWNINICHFCVTHKGLFSYPSQNLTCFLKIIFKKSFLGNCLLCCDSGVSVTNVRCFALCWRFPKLFPLLKPSFFLVVCIR